MAKELSAQAKAALMKKLGIVQADQLKPAEYMLTGFSRIDRIRGDDRLGLLRGAYSVIYGTPGGGKSTVTYQIIANLQKQGLKCLLFNIENSFDKGWATHLGVDIKKLDIVPLQDDLDSTFQTCKEVIESEAYDYVVVDSLHAVGTAREIARDLTEEDAMGILSKKTTTFLRVCQPAIVKTNCHLTIIGQARASMETGGINLTGGNALQHMADWIIQLNRSDSKTRVPLDADDKPIGHVALIYAEKVRGTGNKQRFELPFITGQGFSETRSVIDTIMATPELSMKAFNTDSHFYTWTNKDNEEIKLNGRFKTLDYFEANPDELKRLQQKLMEPEKKNNVEPHQTISSDTSGKTNPRGKKTKADS